METALLKSKSIKDLKLLLKIAKKIGVTARKLSLSETEDLGLANAIRKGKTGHHIDTAKFIKKLRDE
jgi:hypothetical protein